MGKMTVKNDVAWAVAAGFLTAAMHGKTRSFCAKGAESQEMKEKLGGGGAKESRLSCPSIVPMLLKAPRRQHVLARPLGAKGSLAASA